MKKTTVMFVMVLFLISPSIVWGAKKTVTKYLWDTGVEAVATETSSWRDEKTNYAIFASTGTVDVWSYATVKGNIYAKTVKTQTGVTINGNIIAESVELNQNTKVNGYICASNGNVVLNSSGVFVSGNIDAWGNVILGSGCTAGSCVYATGYVTLQPSGASVLSEIDAGGNVAIGSGCTAGASVLTSGTLTLNSSGSKVNGDAHAVGNVTLGSGTTIAGKICTQGTISNNGGTIGVLQNPPCTTPTAPGQPVKCTDVSTPVLTKYTIENNNTATTEAESGKETVIEANKLYGIFELLWKSTVVLTAGTCSNYGEPGCYYFKQFKGGNTSENILKLNLKPEGYITIFSEGDITYSGKVLVSKDGSSYTRIDELSESDAKELAERVYWETHGSFELTGADGTYRQWFGTTLAKTNVTLPYKGWIVGAFAAVDGSVESNSTDTTIHYVLADYARAHW